MVLVENYARHHQNWANCFNDPSMSDVVFEASDGQTFHCEKFVLEVASPHFKKLFSSQKCGGSSKYVSAKDVDPAALKWILRSCYTGDGDLDDDNVVSVMVAAKTYGMDWVENACMKYLKGDQGEPLAAFEYSKFNEKWQEWVVPESGWYHIAAMGAKAANGRPNARLYVSKGGLGAMVGGSFELKAKDVVHILTGGMSRLWESPKWPNIHSGGGGGTFVALKEQSLSLLLAAGGGGSINATAAGVDANLGEDGIGTNVKCLGGKNGGNGSNNGISRGGLGWKSGPVALAKPSDGAVNSTRGFGGGGDVCGGGGGYSGGSAGSGGSSGYGYAAGGGGGSYVSSVAQHSWKKIGNLGHGKVFVWKGKAVPSNEIFFLKEFGDISEGSQANEKPIHSWEIVG